MDVADDPMISLLATLSLPQNSNSISLDVGNIMKTQAKDLGQIIPEKMDGVWQKDVTKNQVRVSQLQGITDSVSSFTKMYLKEVLNEKPETTYFGMSDIGNVMNLPNTEKEKVLAVEALKTSLKSIVDSVAESTKYTIEIHKLVKNIQEEEERCKGGPKKEKEKEEEEGEYPGAPRKLPIYKEPLPEETNKKIEDAKRKRLIWSPDGTRADDKLIAEKRKIAFMLPEIDSSWNAMSRRSPKSVVDAIAMILYLPRSAHKRSVHPYDPIKYLAKSGKVSKKDVIDPRGSTDLSEKRDVVLRKLLPTVYHPEKEILTNVMNSSFWVRPILHVDKTLKTIKLEIPTAYVNAAIEGLPEWSNLLGYAVHFRIETLRGMKDAEKHPEIVHQFGSLELEHSEKQREKSVHYLFAFPRMDLSEEIGFKSKISPVSLLGSEKTDVVWTDVTADVTRVYINNEKYSKTYREFQQRVLKKIAEKTTLSRGNQMTFGEASDDKFYRLLHGIIHGQPSPVDFVVDYNVPAKNVN